MSLSSHVFAYVILYLIRSLDNRRIYFRTQRRRRPAVVVIDTAAADVRHDHVDDHQVAGGDARPFGQPVHRGDGATEQTAAAADAHSGLAGGDGD